MKKCKHVLKYNSELWTCGIDMQDDDGKSHCGRDLKTGEYVVYRNCLKYEPVEKKSMSIADVILRDAGFKEVPKE